MEKILKPSFLLLAVILICCLFPACKDDPKETPDAIGTFTWSEWQAKSGWSDHSASDFIHDDGFYKPDSFAITINSKYRFELYASNWCHKDCEPQVPRIIKFLKAYTGVVEKNIIIYGLNRTRTEPTDAINKWNEAFPGETLYVPTLVISVNNVVVGKVKCETSDFPQWQSDIAKSILTNFP